MVIFNLALELVLIFLIFLATYLFHKGVNFLTFSFKFYHNCLHQMMYYQKNTVNAIQTAMIALILLSSMSSFSYDVVFFFPIHCFFLPAIVHSALPICLFEPAIRPLAVVVIFTARSTACV